LDLSRKIDRLIQKGKKTLTDNYKEYVEELVPPRVKRMGEGLKKRAPKMQESMKVRAVRGRKVVRELISSSNPFRKGKKKGK